MSRALFKIREFFAEKIYWAQYPKQTLLTAAVPQKLPFSTRFGLILFASITIPLGLLALFVVGLLVWAAFTA